MTEMVYGAAPRQDGDPILPRWWRTIDKWSVSAILLLFGIGLLLGLASSPPLAERNGVAPFHYVGRQLLFGGIAFVAMFLTTMMRPELVRRLGVIGFFAAFVALALLPLFGTDFGKGAVRWYSLGFASLQPSEFLKPVYVITVAWLMATSFQIGAPPGRAISLVLTMVVVGFLAMQPDFGQSVLVLFGWGVMYFVAGASYILIVAAAGAVVLGGVVAYQHSEHFARRIDGFFSPDLDPRTQLGYATDAIREGGFFGVGVGEGVVKWSLPDAHTDFIIAVAAEEYGLLLVLLIIGLYARTRPVHPARGHRACGHVRGAGADQPRGGGAAAARKGHDPALRELWRLVAGGHGARGGDAAGLYPDASAGADRRHFRPGAGAMKPLLVIAAGGTGGHMFPAQALAEEMLARGWRVRLSTDARGARYAGGFPQAVEIARAASATFARGGALAKLAVPLRIAGGVLATLARFVSDRPAVVVGFGGYPSIPALTAAWLLRLPRMIHEQNGVPGSTGSPAAPGPRARCPPGPSRSIPATRCAARWPRSRARHISRRATRSGCW